MPKIRNFRFASGGIRRLRAGIRRPAGTPPAWRKRGRVAGDAGVAAIWIALLVAILLGFTSLGVEIVLALQQQRRMQAAADSAAIAAAISLSRGEQSWTQEGYAVAGKAGFTSENHACADTGPDVVSISHPCDGAHQNDPLYVEAIIRKPFDVWLARPLGLTGLKLPARAVASIQAARACVLVLDPASVASFKVNGTPDVAFNNCSVVVDSTASPAATVTGTAIVTCPRLFVAGTQSGVNATACPYTEHAQPAADPYLGVNPPFVGTAAAITALLSAKRTAIVNTETISPINGANPNGLNPVRLLGGIPSKDSPSAVTKWDFCPGIYVIDGGPTGGSPGDPGKFNLTAAGMSVQLLMNTNPACAGDSGTGLAFVLTSSGSPSSIPIVKVQSGVTLGTAAQPLQGIDETQAAASGLPPNTLFWQNRNVPLSGANNSNFSGTVYLGGILYFPHQPLQLTGNATTSSSCFQTIAWQLTLSGNTNFTIDGCNFETQGAIPGHALLVE